MLYRPAQGVKSRRDQVLSLAVWVRSAYADFSCDNCLSTTKASATEACTAGEELNGRSCCFPSPETAAVLKRTVEALMENGAVVRNLENLGERALPYKISKHKQRHRRGGTEPSETLHRFGSQFPLGLGGNTPPSGLGFFSREKRKGENHNQMSHELCRGEYKPFLEGIFKACRLAKLIYYNRLPV
uniref:Small ribosomal subunit protein bS6m n=1 Tax=Anas platyrhynchos platyrhynchos TaxID=8840 RepID=A0A493TRN4_ANAPP